ncbi:MAG: hypothetical protein JRH17_16990 [Deltaproteobacteria bacterium]|nr:hypothetical protein [Deltaproteobacteria bacterium]MBW2696665.1 hypothetical protein [Deltaproteobacteria bacterium]
MPSDPRIQQALDALAEPIEAFRSTLANTSEQIRLLISTRVERNGSSVEVARAELGDFAAGRIDPERMANLLSKVEPQAIGHGEVVGRALEVSNELLARRENLFRVVVGDGDDLHAAVGRALAEIGRAFAVTRIVELVARDEYRDSEHAALLDGHPFEHWSRTERKVDLALVVSIAGRDLRVGGLADFLDRSLKLVLVVDGEAPTAPLVRLITPKVLVMQTTDPLELEYIARHDGPGVVALVPDSVAQFRHDPAGGPALADRMVIMQLPNKNPRVLGLSSAFQQRQDLAQLEALAATPAISKPSAAPAPGPAPKSETREIGRPGVAQAVKAPGGEQPAAAPGMDALDKLSAWLLDHADLSGPTST